MAAPALGRMHEQTFNEALADALRNCRRVWRENRDYVIAERQGVLVNAERERPDILVAPPDIYPIIIEVEFNQPAFGDARKKLGRQVAGTLLPVRSAIAVGVPGEIRHWSNDQLRQRLAQPGGVELQYAILSANVQGDEGEVTLRDEDVHTWPASGQVTGTLDDLADLCEYAAAPPMLVSQTADSVARQIKNLAETLFNGLPPGAAKDIAARLGQSDEKQGLRLACCIWLTSIRLHNLLAEKSSEIRAQQVNTIAQMRSAGLGGVITAADFRTEWSKILGVNYGAIFHTARAALDDRIPAQAGSDALRRLTQFAEQVDALRLGNRVDFTGELFPKLLDDREETAAHYTLSETAELLARLAVDRISVSDWASPEAAEALRAADLACGTGALLRATYGHIRRRHEAAGGASEDLHRVMMERAITGLDINMMASHMTASGLSAAEIQTHYQRTNIAAVSVAGGKTGSLELLAGNQITDVVGQLARSAVSGKAEAIVIGVPDTSQDLVIQNPPYSRARGDRKLFDVAGIDEEQRQRSVKRLTSIRARLRRNGDEITDGQAGLGADFSALAHRKLKWGGVFASVLPLTAAHADSWEGFRRTIEREYHRVTAIAFSSDTGAMMSADTHMNEMLLIATKRDEPAGSEGRNEPSRITCVNLSRPPESAAAASWYAKWIGGIDQSGRNSDVIHEGGRTIGNWTRVASPKPGFPWFAVGMSNHHLAAAIAELMQGRLYSPSDRKTWNFSLGFTTLYQVVGIGPTHHLIGHVRGAGEEIGAFAFDEIAPGELPTYPALWAADSETQRAIMTAPTHDGTPVDDANADRMLSQRSDLFISRNLRMTSQSLAAVRTDKPAMGGRAWTALRSDNEGVKSALLIWLNSTPGLMLRTAYSQTTQQGRATMQIKALAGFPAPDFAAAGESGERARTIAQKHFGKLSALLLEPVSYAFRDENRQRIDEAALEMLGLGQDSNATDAVARLREHWCREPSVHGGSRKIMKALGIGN